VTFLEDCHVFLSQPLWHIPLFFPFLGIVLGLEQFPFVPCIGSSPILFFFRFALFSFFGVKEWDPSFANVQPLKLRVGLILWLVFT